MTKIGDNINEYISTLNVEHKKPLGAYIIVILTIAIIVLGASFSFLYGDKKKELSLSRTELAIMRAKIQSIEIGTGYKLFIEQEKIKRERKIAESVNKKTFEAMKKLQEKEKIHKEKIQKELGL